MAPPASFVARSKVPVYALAFAAPDTLIYAGGGGKSKSGVANVIASTVVDHTARQIIEGGEVKLSSSEDAPMCLALANGEGMASQSDEEDAENDEEAGAGSGTPLSSSYVNVPGNTASATKRQKIIVAINDATERDGADEKIRCFDWSSSSSSRSVLNSEAGPSTEKSARHTIKGAERGTSITSPDPETYIRTNAVSPDGRYLVMGSTDGQVALHELPSLQKVWSIRSEDNAGILDTSFSADSALVAVVMPSEIVVYPTIRGGVDGGTSRSDLGQAPKPFQSIRNPSLKGTSGCTFRAARFGRSSKTKEPGKIVGASNRLFTVVNANPPSGLGTSKKDRELARIRRCFVSTWDTDSWTLIKTRQISERPATVMELSDVGDVLAVGTSDLALHLLRTDSLRSVWLLRDAHAFPSTCLAFDPRGRTIVSGSADMTLRIVDVGSAAGAVFASVDVVRYRLLMIALTSIFALLAWQLQSRFIIPAVLSS